MNFLISFLAHSYLKNKRLNKFLKITKVKANKVNISEDESAHLIIGAMILVRSGRMEEASSYLFRSFHRKVSKLVSRICTYGFPSEISTFLLENQQKFESIQGCKSLFSQNVKSSNNLLYQCLCSAVFVQKKKELARMALLEFCGIEDALTKYLFVKFNLHNQEHNIFEYYDSSLFDGSTKVNATIENVVTQILQKTHSSQHITPHSENEVSQFFDDFLEETRSPELTELLKTNNITTNFADTAIKCMLAISKADYKKASEIISDSLKAKNRANLAFLDTRTGPTKVFIAGFGWSGSGAVYDGLRGIPDTETMPGAMSAPYLNDDADTEPMLYQGPASLLKLSQLNPNNLEVTTRIFLNYLRLYVFCGAPRSYFEYKTVHCNLQLRKNLGAVNYEQIVLNLLLDLTKAISKGNNSLITTALKMFEGRIVKSLFPNDEAIILMNNAINSHKVEALKFVSGKAHYISVDRKIQDQFHDQLNSNIFFDDTPYKFCLRKMLKLGVHLKKKHRVLKSINSNDRLLTIHELTFEDWVQNSEVRSKLVKDIFSSDQTQYLSRYFQPSQSLKNIGLGKANLEKAPYTLLSGVQYFNQSKIGRASLRILAGLRDVI